MAATSLARTDRRIAATVDLWDSDPLLLNTPAGVVDLRTGECRGHRPDNYTTKITGCAPDASCPIPIWRSFLDRVTGGDKALIDFLQRMAGYSLTGLTREHAVFFLYGSGGNGKTTYLNVLSSCAGDYHRAAPIETFTASANERHPTDLAGLCGARLVTAVETEEGRHWAESRIKALTGGDKIAARFMRQDFFEFTPAFKLIIAGNHKPGLRSVDEAIRRRFHLVPFTVTIPPTERDQALPERLQAEFPGILAWMIAGAREWQEHGLAPPEAVKAATDAYLEAEDALTTWIDESCERDPNNWEASKTLFASWKLWADKSGEDAGTLKRFVQNLETRGLPPERRKVGRGIRGLHLRPQDYSDAFWNR
jgi:putative DNA primase/helicase